MLADAERLRNMVSSKGLSGTIRQIREGDQHWVHRNTKFHFIQIGET